MFWFRRATISRSIICLLAATLLVIASPISFAENDQGDGSSNDYPPPSEASDFHNAVPQDLAEGDASDLGNVDSEPEKVVDVAAITAATVKQQLEAVQASTELDADQKSKVAERLRKAIELFRLAESASQKTTALENQIKSAPEKIAALRNILAKEEAVIQIEAFEKLSLIDLETEHQAISDRLSKAEEDRLERKKQANDLISRQELQSEVDEQSNRLEEVQKQLETAVTDEPSLLTADSIRAELTAREKMLQAQVALLETQIKHLEAMREVNPLQNDVDQRMIAELEETNVVVSELLNRRRQEESDRKVAQARQRAKDTDEAFQKLAQRNTELAEDSSNYTDRFSRATNEFDRYRGRLIDQIDLMEEIKVRVGEVGHTEAIGMLLRAQRRKLLDPKPLRQRRREISRDLPDVEAVLIGLQEEREPMWDLDELARQYVAQINPKLLEHYRVKSPSLTPQEKVTEEVRKLLEERRDYLDGLIKVVENYEEKLTDLDTEARRSIEQTLEHRSYIDEHILWIRSTKPLTKQDLIAAPQGARALLNRNQWKGVLQDIGQEIRNRPVQSLIAFAVFAISLGLIDRLKDSLKSIGESKEVQATYRLMPSFEALGLTLLIASYAPALTYLLGWRLAMAQGRSDLSFAVGNGLQWTALMWWALSFLRQISRPKGLGESHFGWHVRNLNVLRTSLRWLCLLGLPMVFAVTVIETYQDGVWRHSLGRLAFLCGMLIMTGFMHFLLNPYKSGRGVWANDKVWLYQFRHIMHTLGVAIPLTLGVLSAIGYVFSAYQLAYRAQLTLWLALGVMIGQALISRYLLLMRRRAIMRHRRKLQEQSQQEDAEEGTPIDDGMDFDTIGDQLKRLVRGCVVAILIAGTSFIWADMVPALKMLNRVQLWQTTVQVKNEVLSPDGTITKDVQPMVEWVTLSDLLLFALTVVLTFVATRNLPGLLNITIFERLPFDRGTRYALTLVTRYVMTLVGSVIALKFIGITWHSVQWLAAAMTVGLGFGLQEIFANFVSGLIILTERPIRVGDMVTVGGVTGKVSRMQMRATTVTDLDKRELVVPNKKFITEDVINWTLSDPVTRVVLPVGISYDCDPEAAEKLLLQVAARHPLVLDDPKPDAVFVGFGDSTLDLELRVFMTGRDNHPRLLDEVNLAINKAFRAADIEIAYPQRDLHLRGVSEAALIAASQKREDKKAA